MGILPDYKFTFHMFRELVQEAASGTEQYAEYMSGVADRLSDFYSLDHAMSLYDYCWLLGRDGFAAFRKKMRLSKAAIQEHFGVPIRTIYSWESGERDGGNALLLLAYAMLTDLAGI